MIDALIPEFDKALRALFAPAPTRRPMPGADLPEAEMNEAEKRARKRTSANWQNAPCKSGR